MKRPQTNLQEKWLPIIGYEGLYEISNMGKVKSLPKQIKLPNSISLLKERILMGACGKKSGYLTVKLSKNSITKTYYIHKLVSYHFIGICPNKYVVNHIDGNRKNNSLLNLEYVTSRENNTICKLKYSSCESSFGVTKRRGKYEAYISSNGKWHYLGLHIQKEIAEIAYKLAVDVINKNGDITKEQAKCIYKKLTDEK
jgi:hypothetical protein